MSGKRGGNIIVAARPDGINALPKFPHADLACCTSRNVQIVRSWTPSAEQIGLRCPCLALIRRTRWINRLKSVPQIVQWPLASATQVATEVEVANLNGKHSAHARAVMGSAGFGGCYGESACAGGRQGLPSMRSCRASMALRPCLRAVSM